MPAKIGPPARALPPGVTRHAPPAGSRPKPRTLWAEAVSRAALALGFRAVGFVPARRFENAAERVAAFVTSGWHGNMHYLAASGDRADPHALLPEAETVVVVALPYAGGERLVRLRRARDDAPRIEMAGYALGADYHHVVKFKLRQLADECALVVGGEILARACVDTAPLLEREAARLAGVAFIGKSTMSIVPGVGSYFVLGELLIDAVIEPAGAPLAEGCGRCRICLDACPTGAFVGPHQLDARRCIAYLTIEHRDVIPEELRAAIGRRVFGCDVCQDVCPYNASAVKHPVAAELEPRPEVMNLQLVDLLELTAARYRRLVHGSALSRATRRMLQRNAAVALGNSNWPGAVTPLTRALSVNPSDLVRGHAAWALGRLLAHAPDRVTGALTRACSEDPVAWVREEARRALPGAAGRDQPNGSAIR